MNVGQTLTVQERLLTCLRAALPTAVKTGWFLLRITIPVSFVVFLLKIAGILRLVALVTGPLFARLGLPGESALVFVTAALLNVYSAIAVIQTLGLTGRVATILALMCLISHNLPVETAIQKRTGSNALAILFVRLLASVAGALALNLLLPPEAAVATTASVPAASAALLGEFKGWLGGMAILCLKIMTLIVLLMILEKILDEFGVTRLISRALKYPLMALGIPAEAAFLWVIANTLGLAYGAGIMIDHVDGERLTRQQADILNYHIAISHSLLEDTLLFVAIGVSVWWIVLPRLALAGVAVWVKRGFQRWRTAG